MVGIANSLVAWYSIIMMMIIMIIANSVVLKGKQSTPSILYPVFYILYPMSYVLCPISYILYPVFYILHPISYSLEHSGNQECYVAAVL